MKNKTTKVALFILSFIVITSCSMVKRVPEGKHLLAKNEIMVNGEIETSEEVSNQLYQTPNSSILGFRLRLALYNMAKPNADSSYAAWLERNPERHKFLTGFLSEKQVQRLGNSFVVSGFSNFLKKTGEPPVVIDPKRTNNSITRLNSYYYNKGYFNAKINYTVDTLEDKKAQIKYEIVTGTPYKIDSINTYIQTPALDSLYKISKNRSLLKKGEQYSSENFKTERERITDNFRNNGAYHFQQNNINYTIDTINTQHKANVDINIDNEIVRQGDSVYERPFKIYKISQVNIFTKNPTSDNQYLDSVSYNGFNIYSTGKLNYRPKAITNAVFITEGSTFSDFRRVLTSRYLSNLRVFNYPTIQYVEDSTDIKQSSLIANIYLNPRKKFLFNVTTDFTHSNIQDFGIQGSLGVSIRNIFKGAEILEISTRGNIGSSRDLANPNNNFFNISEYGADLKLTIPSIFFPINTEKIIPKNMIPSTAMSFGLSRQRNIGLDKENFTGILNYNWTPPRRNATARSARLDLFNIQYIKNVNAPNYFNVYRSSYSRLNEIAQSYAINPEYLNENNNLIIESGTSGFINDVRNGAISMSENDLQAVNRIEERRRRLTENNLIFATNFTYTINTKANLVDNDFFIFKTKVESAGNVISLLANTINEPENRNGNRTLFDVEYSQYIKGEIDFIKHWDLSRGKVLAMRSFAGIAIPYGNSNSIPFTRSYFGGGSNDNRGWQAYSLGPGRSGGLNDFNEANFKLAYSTEFRFNMFGKLNGALFTDVGNIWNVFDSETDTDFTFNGLKSLKDLAVGSGFGFRYDFNFFIVRFDIGFKTYNPARQENDRWFKEYNFKHSVLNVGINYPF